MALNVVLHDRIMYGVRISKSESWYKRLIQDEASTLTYLPLLIHSSWTSWKTLTRLQS